jgi:hypothetical protein
VAEKGQEAMEEVPPLTVITTERLTPRVGALVQGVDAEQLAADDTPPA